MTEYVITGEQLENLSAFVYGGFYDEYEYQAAKDSFIQIKKQSVNHD